MADASPPSPELFLDTVRGYQRTAALKGAQDLDLFSAIGDGRQTAERLAERCGASPRGVRVLCDYLTILGFLTKQDGRYGLTPESAMFLDRRSPAYLGDTVRFLLSSLLTEAFKDVAAAVRRGGTVVSEEGTLAPEHPIWVEFARAMMPLMRNPAQALVNLVRIDPGRRLKVLDIAAGHGIFGITFAERYPRAEVVALDWPNVLEVAKENARAAGVSSRYRTVSGSAFEVDFGTGYDLVLLTNFLHHFDPAACERVLTKVHAALTDGGRAVTLDFIPNEDRISPPDAAAFSLVMLCSTPSGDAYTFVELDRMFRSAGFARNELHPLPLTPHQVVISHT
ncbi:MAG TPA: class I SAM-dependent methyltransferase [Candidatus Methylomirabilis sp.]|nr:class I SAM-dependent methyltransferase [Candidatus Methylomirabilis sp.]